MTALDIPAITSRTAEAASWVARHNPDDVPDAVWDHFAVDMPALLAENAWLRADVEHLRAQTDAPRRTAWEPGS